MGYKICYTGNGGGKTLAAIGLAVRAWGHGKRVVVVQFMKGREDIGEFLAAKKIPGIGVFQFGRKEFVDLKNPSEEDKKLAKEGLKFAKEALMEAPDMLVLDEVCMATSIGLLKTQDVIDLINSAPENTIIVLTGRYASQELIYECDFVTKLEDTKTIPMDQRKEAQPGFEY